MRSGSHEIGALIGDLPNASVQKVFIPIWVKMSTRKQDINQNDARSGFGSEKKTNKTLSISTQRRLPTLAILCAAIKRDVSQGKVVSTVFLCNQNTRSFDTSFRTVMCECDSAYLNLRQIRTTQHTTHSTSCDYREQIDLFYLFV